ncbi:hypothetical protein QEN19_000233 [Hanseniaspora menglaensis]
MAQIFTQRQELEDLNFGFEYDDISSFDHKSIETDDFQNFPESKLSYYDINDIVATNKDFNHTNSHSPSAAYFFSPSSVNYKLWLQQQLKQ